MLPGPVVLTTGGGLTAEVVLTTGGGITAEVGVTTRGGLAAVIVDVAVAATVHMLKSASLDLFSNDKLPTCTAAMVLGELELAVAEVLLDEVLDAEDFVS